MEEMDVIKLIKQLKKEAIKDTFTDKINLWNILSILSLNVSSAFANNIFFLIYVLFYDVVKAPAAFNKIKNDLYILAELAEQIEKTETYKICNYEYHEYIHNLAQFIKFLGITDSMQIAIYLSNFMYNGYASKNKECVYRRYKYDLLSLEGMIGARVLNGDFVCRHATHFLNDVLNASGVPATSLGVILKRKSYDELSKRQKAHLKIDHSISVILEGDYKYGYDITNLVFANFNKDIHQLDVVGGDQHYLIADYSLHFMDSFEKNNIFKDKEFKIISPEEIAAKAEQTEFVMKVSKDYLKMFYNDNLKKVREIATLEEQLAPRSDQMIKKWVIK